MHMLPLIAAIVSVCLQPAGKHHATVQLVPETLSIIPGGTIHLLAHFKIDQRWHLYWDGQNDTGQPPRFKWNLPPGWTISEPEFPAPHRNEQPGGIIDYIYENQLTLTFTLTAPKESTAKTAKISADVEWLECADTCMFGGGKIETTLPLEGSEPKPNPAAKPLLETLKSTRVLPLKDAKGATIAIQKDIGVITVPGATRLVYFPGNASSSPREPTGTAANGETLRVQFAPKEGPVIVNGIVAVYRTKQGPPAYYWAKAQEAPAATEPAGKSIKKDE